MANNSSFGIMVNTILDTKTAEQQLQKFTKNREVITKIKITNPDTGKIETALKKVTTLVDQYGRKVKETRVIDLNGKEKEKEIKSISDSFKTLNTQTNKYKDGMGAVVTEIKKFDQFGNSATTRIREYTDAQGYAVKETQQFNAVGEQVGETVKQMTRDLTKEESEVKKDTEAKKENSKATKEMSNSNKNLGQSFADIVAKVSKFYLATLPIQTMQKTISEAVETVKEFDKAITEMGKVSDYSGERLRQYTRDLAEMGAETGRTLTEVTEATTGWLKAGYNEEDASKLAKYSALLQNTADEQLSGAEATEILVSQLKAYHMEADEAIKVTDILNKVSAKQAVSSGDIAKGLTQASASMATYGNSIEETTALLTGGVTIFQGKASQVARGLNAISSRLIKNREDVEKYIDSVEDQNGHLKSTMQIMQELKPAWDKMTDAEKANFQTTVIGINQGKIFSAVMSQMDVVQEAYTQALNSSGETMKQNEVYMSGLEAKTNLLKAEFEKLVIGKGGLQDFAKMLVDVGTAILKFANSDIGQAIIKFGEFVVVLSLVSKAWKGLQAISATNVLASAITSLIAGEATLAQVTKVLTAKFIENAIAFASTPMGMVTIVTGSLIAIVSIVDKYNKRLEENTKKLKENADAYKQAQSEVDNLEESLKKVREQMDAINSSGEISITDEKQLNLLQEEEKVLKRQLAIAQQKAEIARKELEASATKTLGTTIKSHYATETGDMGAEWAKDVLPTQELELATQKYNELSEAMRKNSEEMDYLIENKDNLSESGKQHLEQLQEENNSLEKQMDAVKSYGADVADSVQTATEAFDGSNETEKETITTNNELLDSWYKVTGAYDEVENSTENITDSLDEEGQAIDDAEARLEALANAHNVALEDLKAWAKELGISEEELLDYADAMGVTVEQAYRYQASIKSWNNSIDSLQSAYGTLTSAVEEYNSSNGFTLDTLQSLLSLSPEYLGMLTEENGKLKLNEQAIINKANALIEERKQTALQIATDKLRAIEIGNSASAEVDHKAKVENNTVAIKEETEALKANAKAYATKIVAESGGKKQSAVNQVLKELEQELAMIDKIGDGYGKVTTSAIKAGNAGKSGSKGATDALKEQNKELEKLKSNYDKVASYITSALDKKIKSIQKEKDSALDAVEVEIKGIEKEKDSALNAIDETIDAREKEKKIALANIEAEIKAIEKEKNARLESLKAQKKELQDAQDKELDSIQKKIDLLSEEKESITSTTQVEIDSIKSLKEEREKYWDAQIDALKEQNNQLKDSLEFQEKLDALEKAKATKTKVFKKGEGFVYDVDQTKVAEAQKALDEYLSEKAYEDELERLENFKKAEIDNYTDRIDSLTTFKDKQSNNYKEQIEQLTKLKNERKLIYQEQIDVLSALIDAEQDKYDKQLDALKEQKESLTEYYTNMLDELKAYKESVQNSYEEQISALEEHKDALGRNYDQEIEYYQNYKEQFENMVNAYEDQQNKLLFTQLTGLSAENDNWMTRLDNLAKFVSEYNALKAKLDTDNTNITSSYNGTNTVKESAVPKKSGVTTTHSTIAGSAYSTKPTTKTKTHSTIAGSAYATHADGISSIKNDEIAIVGEDPNKELVIGSKINNGQLMSLDKGTGVVNAKSTKSMAGLLNQIGSFGGSLFGAGNGVLNNNTTNNDAFTINGVTINGAGITDPQSFATALMNFKSEAISRAYRRNK